MSKGRCVEISPQPRETARIGRTLGVFIAGAAQRSGAAIQGVASARDAARTTIERRRLSHGVKGTSSDALDIWVPGVDPDLFELDRSASSDGLPSSDRDESFEPKPGEHPWATTATPEKKTQKTRWSPSPRADISMPGQLPSRRSLR